MRVTVEMRAHVTVLVKQCHGSATCAASEEGLMGLPAISDGPTGATRSAYLVALGPTAHPERGGGGGKGAGKEGRRVAIPPIEKGGIACRLEPGMRVSIAASPAGFGLVTALFSSTQSSCHDSPAQRPQAPEGQDERGRYWPSCRSPGAWRTSTPQPLWRFLCARDGAARGRKATFAGRRKGGLKDPHSGWESQANPAMKITGNHPISSEQVCAISLPLAVKLLRMNMNCQGLPRYD